MSRWWEDKLTTAFFIALVGGVIALAVWLIWLTAPPTEGYVRDKRATAEYTHWHDGGTSCLGYDTMGNCTYKVDNPDYPHQHCEGTCYELYLSHCKIKDGKQKCRKGWISLGTGPDAKAVYDKYGIGDYYPSPR